MSIDFALRAAVPDHVMFRELEGESVILDLNTELYFGLDPVGTRMWQLLTTAESIEAAYADLTSEYEVDTAVLRTDLDELIETLVDKGLLSISEHPAPA